MHAHIFILFLILKNASAFCDVFEMGNRSVNAFAPQFIGRELRGVINYQKSGSTSHRIVIVTQKKNCNSISDCLYSLETCAFLVDTVGAECYFKSSRRTGRCNQSVFSANIRGAYTLGLDIEDKYVRRFATEAVRVRNSFVRSNSLRILYAAFLINSAPGTRHVHLEVEDLWSQHCYKVMTLVNTQLHQTLQSDVKFLPKEVKRRETCTSRLLYKPKPIQTGNEYFLGTETGTWSEAVSFDRAIERLQQIMRVEPSRDFPLSNPKLSVFSRGFTIILDGKPYYIIRGEVNGRCMNVFFPEFGDRNEKPNGQWNRVSMISYC